MDWRKLMGVEKQVLKNRSYPQYPHNPQYSGLEDNITDITDITDKGQKIKLDDPEMRYDYEERCAIMEFDGGLSREEAERLAREVGHEYPEA